jgi:hypothetical protein
MKRGRFIEKSYYSVRSATTGSFLAALREGMMPASMVSRTLITVSVTAT